MTMKTLLTAAAIISSAGFGVGKTPASRPSNHSSAAPVVFASADAQLSDEFASLDQQANPLPPEPWAKTDPADSLYRLAREALSRGDYKRAAEIFHSIPERYPQSAYAGQAMYYEAFSLYRSGGDDELSAARDRLNQLKQKYPSVATGDRTTLMTRVCGELAKRGDEACTMLIDSAANKSSAKSSDGSGSTQSCPPDDDDPRIEALKALLQMDADRAMPILKQVLARRDRCSVTLRRTAVFLVSQKQTPETANILMGVARDDPDQEVREQAVFWLSQVPGSTPLLEGILKGNADEGVKEKALFSISQQDDPRAQQILRDFALRENEDSDLREKAIFWLGQRSSTENTQFLRSLYSRLTNEDLKEKVMFSLSQQRGAGNEQWLMSIVVDPKEDVELRKKALFWAGQSGVATAELAGLYDRLTDAEIKDHMIFVLSQRQKDAAANNKLFDIAKNEKDPELRKKAIFWLGQSRDPRAQQFLIDLINK
jgi:tetratricopeptide (TPR) repeat protein